MPLLEDKSRQCIKYIDCPEKLKKASDWSKMDKISDIEEKVRYSTPDIKSKIW